MKKFVGLFAFFLLSSSVFAVDLAVPEELIGSDTLAIVHVHLKSLKMNQIGKTLTEKLGTPPDAATMDTFKTVLDGFKAAGGQGISIMFNAGKGAAAENAPDGAVFIITKGEDADNEKLTELFNAFLGGMTKDKMAKGCPKEIGDSLVWHSAKFKLPKPDEDREAAFAAAYAHLAKDSSISVVIIPDEEAVALAEEKLKDSKPEEKKLMTALLGADGYCVFTDFGISADPAVKIMVLSADADGAKVINKTALELINTAKAEAPPAIQAVLKSLNVAQIGANVQLGIDLGDLVKAVASMAEMFAPKKE